MDANEIARRLQRVRQKIQEHLAEEPPPGLGDGAPDEADLRLEEMRRPPPVPDTPDLGTTEHLITANRLATIAEPVAITSSVPVVGPLLTLARRLARPFVQPFIDPYVARQERFNAEVVRHLNELGDRLEHRLGGLTASLREWAEDPLLLEARLENALSDYDAALRHRHTLLFDALEEELWAAQNMLRDLQQEQGAGLQRLEVMLVQRSQAVDRRFDEKDEAIDQRFDEVTRAMDARIHDVRHQVAELLTLRRELRRLLSAPVDRGATQAAGAEHGAEGDAADGRDGGVEAGSDGRDGDVAGDGGTAVDAAALSAWLGDSDYVAFQHAFRGDPDDIGRRLRRHVEKLRGVPGPVADLGCGRGELLELLGEAGIEAVGVEINAAEVQDCVARGLAAEHDDLFAWLQRREDGSLGAVFLAQVIEHLEPADWSRLVDLAADKLAPGGRLMIETINPESLFALARAYVIDPTHVRPVHPELLAFLSRRAGFHPVEVELQAPVPDEARPLPIDLDVSDEATELDALLQQLNERLRRLDRLCCAPQEYILVATRPAASEAE